MVCAVQPPSSPTWRALGRSRRAAAAIAAKDVARHRFDRPSVQDPLGGDAQSTGFGAYLTRIVYRLANALNPDTAGALADRPHAPFFLAVTVVFLTTHTFLVEVVHLSLAPWAVFGASLAFLPFLSLAGGFFADWLPRTATAGSGVGPGGGGVTGSGVGFSLAEATMFNVPSPVTVTTVASAQDALAECQENFAPNPLFGSISTRYVPGTMCKE